MVAVRVSVAERRKAPRVPVDFEMKYRVLRGRSTDSKESGSYRSVRVRNISQYGLAIAPKEALEEGDILHTNFTVDGREIDAFCAVVWSEFNINMQEFEVGLEFDFLGQYDAMFLVQFIKKTLEGYGLI